MSNLFYSRKCEIKDISRFTGLLRLYQVIKLFDRSFKFNQVKYGCVCFLKSDFQGITFQIFLCLFVIRKVGQRKTLSGQRKVWFGF